MLKAKYAECKDELADLEEVMTYVAVCLGKDDSITNNFIKQVKREEAICATNGKTEINKMKNDFAHINFRRKR